MVVGTLGVLVLGTVLPAQGQSFGVTNSIAKGATTSENMGSAVKVDDAESVSCTISTIGSEAGTGNITVTFARSQDNSVWETTPQFTWICALNGRTAVVAYTNLTTLVGAAKYVKVISVANADANAAATNFVVKLDKKFFKVK